MTYFVTIDALPILFFLENVFELHFGIVFEPQVIKDKVASRVK